jgi:hypothetical protein
LNASIAKMQTLARKLRLGACAVFFLAGQAWASDYKVVVLDASKVYPGRTLFTDVSKRSRQAIVEVDSEGRVLWRHEPSEAIRGTLLDATYLDDDRVLFTVKGYGVVEINRAGRTLWQHRDAEASHDADRLPNGNTLYNRSWVQKGEDVVREVSPSGEIVWSWNGLREFDKPPFASIKDEGWMHVNAVTRMPSGHTLISIRNFNAVVEVNPAGDVLRSWVFRAEERKTIATEGAIRGERNHEPEVLPSGNLLLALRKPFRYVELNPETQKIVWQWAPPNGAGVNKLFNRDVNRLPNGNTLVTTANQLIEVTMDGTIVWRLDGPAKADSGDTRVFHKVIRRGPDGLIHGQ